MKLLLNIKKVYLFEIIRGVVPLLLAVSLSSSYVYAQKKLVISDKGEIVEQISLHYKNGKWIEGKKLAENGLKKYPKDSDLKMLLGKYYVNVKSYDKARYELNKSLEYNPQNVDAKQLLVGVETETGRYSSAICFVNELLEVNPYWKGLWRKKIELYRLQGNEVEANRLLQRISQIYPNDSTLQKDLTYQKELKSIEERKDGNIEEAIRLGKELVNNQTQSVTHYIGLIDNYIKAGDYSNALIISERGISNFPGNLALIHKKTSLLEEQKRYDELLSFLQSEINKGYNSALLRQQYNYYLLEAARNAKDKDPATLYGKILESNPGHEEAFKYVLSHLIAQQQYEEALFTLNRYKNIRGDSKELMLEELQIYKRQGNGKRADQLYLKLFSMYPNDIELREEYVGIILKEAKNNMQEESYQEAIYKWQEIMRFGDEEMYRVAQQGALSAYYNSGRLNDALNVLNEIILDDPTNYDNYLKRADIYFQLGRYHNATAAYETLFAQVTAEHKDHLMSGYEDIMIKVIQEMVDEYKYTEALDWVERWLTHDENNKQALIYAINFSHKMKDYQTMAGHAKRAQGFYPDDPIFKVKIADAKILKNDLDNEIWESLLSELNRNPYHEVAIRSFVDMSNKYAQTLIKENQIDQGMEVLTTALKYDAENKELKYLKGIVFEKQQQYDSAFYYQSFYEPSLLEFEDFSQHLNYLKQRELKENFGVSHLRSRYGDDYAITTVSSIEYSRINGKSNYVGRVNYAGRDDGRGLQGQVEWSHIWQEKVSTRIDLALSNRYFSKLAFNASVYNRFLPEWEAELGVGYRKLYTDNTDLMNLVLGATRDFESFMVNAKFNNFLLEGKWLYNLSAQGRYFISNRHNYVLVTGGIGSSPDVELLDRQFYNTFSVVNAMVGAGFGKVLTRNVSAAALGTWYNFQDITPETDTQFRNLYNLYLQLNVAF